MSETARIAAATVRLAAGGSVGGGLYGGLDRAGGNDGTAIARAAATVKSALPRAGRRDWVEKETAGGHA